MCERWNGLQPFGFVVAARFAPVLALLATLALGGLAGTVRAEQAPPVKTDQRQATPEPDSGRTAKAQATAHRFMVVAANPLAAEAGRTILSEGGSAIDAAIAVQMVLNLVEPQSSGIGGGAFILYRDAATRALTTIDGRETAPMAAKPERFLGPDGKPRDFDEAVHSGLSTGVPGLLRALELAHKRFGKLPWKRLFEPAIAMAEQGFPVSRRLSLSLAWQGASTFDDRARSYFFDANGLPRLPGFILKNPELAATLRRIADEGAKAFYEGALAEAIVATLKTAPVVAGDMTTGDLARYEAKERPALCAPYRGHQVCGMGPPSSGGPVVAMVLRLIEPFDLGRTPLAPDALSVIAEAEKLAYADRDRYMADSDFVPFPEGLLSDAYLTERRKLIDPAHPMTKAEPGEPPLKAGLLYGLDGTHENSGTSHISIIDGQGNALAMTTTIEALFGSRLMVNGFLLNNELTDFSFAPADDSGRPAANRVEPGKRPRSSMAPTLVLDPKGEVKLITGSPGGSRIILYVIKSLVCLLDWNCGAQQAADLPNFGSRNGPFEAELGLDGAWMAFRMRLHGYEVRTPMMTSGLHIIARHDGVLEGGADPRREGVALGD